MNANSDLLPFLYVPIKLCFTMTVIMAIIFILRSENICQKGL